MGNGTGITSMILGIIAIILYWLIIPLLIAGAMISGAGGGVSVLVTFIATMIILVAVVFILGVLGLILGFLGAAKNDSKAFGIIGLVLSFAPFFFSLSDLLYLIDYLNGGI